MLTTNEDLGALKTGGALPEGARRWSALRSLQVHVSACRDRWLQAGARCDPRLRDLRTVQASRNELSRLGRRRADPRRTCRHSKPSRSTWHLS